MLFLIVLFSVLSTETAQTWLAQKATNYLSENLGIEAKIAGLKISLTKDIELKDVYLADDHQDTLIFIGNLQFHFNGFNTTNKILKTSNVKLNNGKLYLRKHPEDDVFNFQNFINKLSSNSSNTTASKNLFQWKSSTVEIDSMKFIKHRLGCDDSCTNIFIDYSKISIKDFHLNGGEVDADVKSFVYTDRYRFNLQRLSGKAKFHSDYIEAKDFELKTEETSFSGSARLDYTSLRTLGYFVDSVTINAEIQEAVVSSEEFRSWLPAFPDFGIIEASGHVEGVVNDLNGTNLKASMGSTSFEGNCSVKNATHAKDIYIEATDMNFVAFVEDYQKYIVPLSDYELPGNFKKLKYFNLSGSYIGDLNEIDLKGKVKTALGNGQTDIALTNVTNPDNLSYKGFIDLKDFELGTFLEQDDIGKTSIKGNVNGTGTTTETLDFSGDLDIAYLDFYKYRITNILANGRMYESKFTGELSVNDQNLQGQFDGLVDFNSALQHYNFNLALKHADLYELGVSKDTVAVLTSHFSVDLDYEDINNFKGELGISDITYAQKDNFFFFDSISISSLYSNQKHSIKLNSQLLDAQLDGEFNIVDVIPSLDQITGSFFKFYSPEVKTDLATLDLEYKAQIKNVDLLTLLFVKELTVAPGTEINGYLRMPSQEFKMDLYSPEIKYSESDLYDLRLSVDKVSDSGEIDLVVKHYEYENVSSTPIILCST